MIEAFWNAVLRQDAEEMRTFFRDDAYINWHCTNEHFTVDEYIRANCEYPGQWAGEIQRTAQVGDLTVAVVRVYTTDQSMSFHVTSFLRAENGRIASLDEYWADDAPAPQWRQDLKIGSKIENGT